MTRSIRALLEVPESERQIPWIWETVQTAIQVEWTTIPPYLIAMWSIKDYVDSDVGSMLYRIVTQEMKHMGWACNLLTCLGGTPCLTDPRVVPCYPGPLPGHVHPGLCIPLQRLSREAIANTFMVIEEPELAPYRWYQGRSYPTIGAFYDAVHRAIEKLDEAFFSGQRQRAEPRIQLTAITSKTDACKAVEQIKAEGEGTQGNPLVGGVLAHYFLFGSMFHERLYVFKDGHWDYVGKELRLPRVEDGDVFDFPPVPAGGNPQETSEFDHLYSSMLQHLQTAWTTKDDQKAEEELKAAVKTMSDVLPGKAQKLMGHGFGPSFLYYSS